MDEQRELVVLFDKVVDLDPVWSAGTLHTSDNEMRLRLTWEEVLLIISSRVHEATICERIDRGGGYATVKEVSIVIVDTQRKKAYVWVQGMREGMLVNALRDAGDPGVKSRIHGQRTR